MRWGPWPPPCLPWRTCARWRWPTRSPSSGARRRTPGSTWPRASAAGWAWRSAWRSPGWRPPAAGARPRRRCGHRGDGGRSSRRSWAWRRRPAPKRRRATPWSSRACWPRRACWRWRCAWSRRRRRSGWACSRWAACARRSREPSRAVPARWSARSPPASRGARSPSAPAWASPAPRWRDTLRARMNERSFSREDRMIAPPFTAEHDLFRKTLRDYVVRELAPHALEWDEAGIFPREVFRQLAELGALGVIYPEGVGGPGGDFWHAVVLAEELVHSRNSGVNMGVLVQSQIATP